MRMNALACLALVVGLCSVVFADDITGTWTASFKTDVGVQEYTYTFKIAGTKLTGRARSKETDAEITGTFDSNKVTFVEDVTFQGRPLHIVYTGTMSGDEIKLTRILNGRFKEDLVAKRVKASK